MATEERGRYWIPIGRGEDLADLERVITTLRERWRGRYRYRIESRDAAPEDEPCRYELWVAHA